MREAKRANWPYFNVELESAGQFYKAIHCKVTRHLGPVYTQQIRSVSQFIQVSLNSSWLKSHRIHGVYTVDMPKIIKLQLRFLPLEIYPDSLVYTSANTKSIKICSVTL